MTTNADPDLLPRTRLSDDAGVPDLLRSSGLFNRRTTFVIDALVMTCAFGLTYLLRFDFVVPPVHWRRALIALPLVLFVQFAALYMGGAMSFVWRYVGISEVRTFLRAFGLSGAVLLGLRLFLAAPFGELRIPISIVFVNALIAFSGVLGVRVLRRMHFESAVRRRRLRASSGGARPAVLLVGAGAAGITAVREIHSRGEHDMDVRGFIDDDPLKQGAVIAGLKVLGATAELPQLVPQLGVDLVIICIADAPPSQLRRIVEICERIPVRTQMMPALYDVLQGKVAISRFRDVRIEDLLSRPEVSLEEQDLLEFLGGKVVMVTGAGGSIGSELARQVAHFVPRRLVLLERSEPALFQADSELRAAWPSLDIVPVIADVADRRRLQTVFREHPAQVVVHAAAHKHVPLMETNACEAIKNNVFGTKTISEVAGECGVEAFILISSDKAVRPSSVMGAAKRVAELVVQDVARRAPSTRYVAVRFGNVLGSAGSVIPIFREQIARGGPVTVTHPEMLRYFMTIPEAAVLTLQAGAMGRGGEIFVLDMGEPVPILELATRMIELSGYRRPGDIEITFTGVRPGEKLFEELQYGSEEMDKTRHPKIYVGKIAAMPSERLYPALQQLWELADGGSSSAIREYLGGFLPEAQMSGGAPAGGGGNGGAGGGAGAAVSGGGSLASPARPAD